MNPISRRKFLLGSASLAALANLKACAINGAAERTGLKNLYGDDFLVGTAISNQTLANDDQHLKALIAKEFNSITAENCMKSALVQPRQGEWDWELADRFVEFGLQHNMDIVGHALVWHSQVPEDFFVYPNGRPIDRQELIKRMDTHIRTLVERYKGKIKIWDVVNEAIDEDKGWRESAWFKTMGGADYVERAFRLAHEMDPDAHLIYNDYNMHNPGKREFLVNVLRDYKKRGVPIHGVGLQSHVGLDYPDLSEFEASIEAYAAEGMRIHCTELEVDVLPVAWEHTGANISDNFEYADELNPYPDGLPEDMQERLTERYVEMFKLFLKHRDKIDRITLWGTHDGESWKNNFPVGGRTNYPLLFDRDIQPKPAYFAVADLKR
ncbi:MULTISPECIES: endo-1,4-beta-xylanase [unclassified Marinimicrobium]|jgi:endo-1,4-beta-xylanase|uniref:endo-1,4-beta-xylanase n=1 Tax=unclassified Marinimicrobium TaxID=2632100 RepID=UPI00257B0898|nr:MULTISPECIES: endo-1,4-beta-xylanase [unclassified Marinimicrobium]|tara:strand:+ start:437 stop:1579 length:1143 start_codon:yes stop_codon:yes gene_type:complete